MNNIITNCDNNCSDYQNQTFTVIIADKNGNAVSTYSCNFGQQFTMPAGPIETGRDFLGWNDNNISYPAGATINIQSSMTFVPQYSAENWRTVWTGSSSSSFTNSAIVEGRRTRVTASIVSRYSRYETDGCEDYLAETRTETNSGQFELPTTKGNCTVKQEGNKIVVSFYSSITYGQEGPDGGSITITKVEQFF